VITRLEQNLDDYKVQITLQQQTIHQLNSRYDTVTSQLLSQPKQTKNIRDIFADDDLVPEKNNIQSSKKIDNSARLEANIEIENLKKEIEKIKGATSPNAASLSIVTENDDNNQCKNIDVRDADLEQESLI
jgi:hypothetical protein